MGQPGSTVQSLFPADGNGTGCPLANVSLAARYVQMNPNYLLIPPSDNMHDKVQGAVSRKLALNPENVRRHHNPGLSRPFQGFRCWLWSCDTGV